MSRIQGKTHYEILGVDNQVDITTIKTAYREKLLNTHPDKTNKELDTDIICKIKTAYTVLSNAQSRAEYDQLLIDSFKKSGLISTGEGLDVFSLDDFECYDDDEGFGTFKRDCPRCTTEEGFELNEADLEESGTSDGMGGYEIIVQCAACSLWIKVKYFDMEEEEEEK